MVLQAALPGAGTENVGVLLVDPSEDRLYARFRRDWAELAGEEAEVFEALEDDLRQKAREMGAAALLDYLEETLSNTLRASDRLRLQVADFEARLNKLYREQVASRVLPFRTHVPVVSLRAAAGGLGPEAEVEAEGWEEVPQSVSLQPGMFAAHVEGRSMEPLIPGGSLCLFRPGVVGSRQGRLLLVERFGISDTTAQYTVKRYRSSKRASGEGWQHQAIRLEPLNPDYDAWELTPGEFRVLAEFVCVLIPPGE